MQTEQASPPNEAENKQQKSEAAEIVTIAGGVEIEVRHIDGSKETVKVRQIPATKISEFASKLGDESVSISIYCDKPVEWVDTLDVASLNAIADKGMEINLPFLNAWFRRRAKWTEVTQQGAIAELQGKVETLLQALQSGNYARQSPTTTNSHRGR